MSKMIILQSEHGLAYKIRQLNWGLIILVTLVACVGFTALYSAAGGSLSPWAYKQMIRFALGFCIMIGVGLVDVRWWFRMAWPVYFIGLFLLVLVDFMGHIGMGAQRWINLGIIQLQPSEVMKIAVVLVLARYFHLSGGQNARRLLYLVIPVIIILAPVALVMVQPDLGTAIMILMAGTAMFFMAGVPLWIFITAFVAGVAAVPVGWQFLHAYQKKRVMTFMDPESDPLGAGYHIMQSKIALGSGGVKGKGFLEGTQSHLNFLPEKQTDFIFTLWAEEWGLLGGIFLLTLFALIFWYGIWISMRCRHMFGHYLALGLTVNFSLYALINIAMVMGLIPVVGIPLPLISYGGTAMLSLLTGFGLILSCSLYHDAKVSRI
ncbi:MAG: rod shape-determining protein RodA [Alphaproteobacteria bacterium]